MKTRKSKRPTKAARKIVRKPVRRAPVAKKVAAKTPRPVIFELPRIGTEIKAAGGHFAGLMADEKGGEDLVVIVGLQFSGTGEFGTVNEWAGALKTAGCDAWDCGSRREHRLAWVNVRSLFETDNYYWTSEQHASDSSSAWAQDFYNGSQNHWSKITRFRARAFRRLPISQFIHLLRGAGR